MCVLICPLGFCCRPDVLFSPAVGVNIRCGGLAEEDPCLGNCGKSRCSRSAIKILFDPRCVALLLSLPVHKHTACSLTSSTLHLLFSSPSHSSSPPLLLFSHSVTILYTFFFFYPPLLPLSLSLIKLAGALIKCSSPSRPPPVGLGRALIPSPVPEALKSTARETASFFNFSDLHNPTTALIHAHQSGGWANMLDRAAYWHYNNPVVSCSIAFFISVTIRDQWIAVVIAIRMSSLLRPTSSSLLVYFAVLIIISN